MTWGFWLHLEYSCLQHESPMIWGGRKEREKLPFPLCQRVNQHLGRKQKYWAYVQQPPSSQGTTQFATMVGQFEQF